MELFILVLVINFSLKLIGIKTIYLMISTFIFGAIMTIISNTAPREYHYIYQKNGDKIRINHYNPWDKHMMDIFFIPIFGFIGLGFSYCIILLGGIH